MDCYQSRHLDFCISLKTFKWLLPVHGLLRTGLDSRRCAHQVKLRVYLQPLPGDRITAWVPPPLRSAVALDPHRAKNPAVKGAFEGARWQAPCENLMPKDLTWSSGHNVSTGERLWTQIIISGQDDRASPWWINCLQTHMQTLSLSSKWQLYNYFIIYYSVIIIIKCTINVIHLNQPEVTPTPSLWKNCFPRNPSLVPKRLGAADLNYTCITVLHKKKF